MASMDGSVSLFWPASSLTLWPLLALLVVIDEGF